MDSSRTCFSSESDFCSDCGSVLPPPGIADTVTCPCCSHRTQVTDFMGKYVQTSVMFNKLDTIALSNEAEETGALNGPLIDRRCSRCGYEKMVYYTRQMRSADEGQTVFYTCVQCRQTSGKIGEPITQAGNDVSGSGHSVYRTPPGSSIALHSQKITVAADWKGNF
ncbi:DNA-directed RNA polymerase I subunit RPA12 isoform X2 [Aquarana catesbeiana]